MSQVFLDLFCKMNLIYIQNNCSFIVFLSALKRGLDDTVISLIMYQVISRTAQYIYMAVCELASNSFVTNLSKIQHLISFFKLDECEIIKVFFHPLYLIQTIWNHCVHHLKHQIAGTHYFLPPPPIPSPP